MAHHEDLTKERLPDERKTLRRRPEESDRSADSAFYQDLFECLPDGAVIVDRDGKDRSGERPARKDVRIHPRRDHRQTG